MASQVSARSDFTETLAIHVALKSALKAKQYANNDAVRKAANTLCENLESERSIYGRQLKMIALMEKGASLAEMGKKLHCSRRTVFRYLNHLEDADITIKLDGLKYCVDKSVAKLARA